MTAGVVALPRGRSSHRTPDERAAEELEVLRLKVLGTRDVDICERLNMSLPTVKKRLAAAIERHGSSSVKEYREIAEQRYSFLFAGVAEIIRTDPANLEAYRTGLQITQAAAKLQAAEAPQQLQVEVTQVTEQEKELREMLAQAKADNKAAESVLIEGEVVADA